MTHGTTQVRFAARMTVAAMLTVAATNVLFPRSYAFFAWDYASYFPVPAQLAWLAVCLGLVAACAPVVNRPPDSDGRLSRGAGVVTGALLVLGACYALWALRTPFPGIAGDGENGAACRLGGVMARGVALFLPPGAGACAAAAATQILCGALYVLACALAVLNLRADAWARVGLVGMAVFMPQLAGAHGHCDGYAVALLAQAAWWMALAAFDRQESRRARVLAGTALALAAAVACWAHPLHAILVAATLFFAAAKIIRAGPLIHRYPRILVAGAVGGAFAIAASALAVFPGFLVRPEEQHGFQALRGDYVPWFIHSCLAGFLCTALPGVLLAGWLWKTAPRHNPPGAAGLTALLAGLAALLCRFTLPFTQGVNDEFCAGILGTMAVAAALILFLCEAQRPQWRVLLCFAVFAMYLQVPRVMLYGTDLYLERCRALFPHDRCPHNSRMSPYTHLGLILPADTPELRQFKLAVFAEGATTKIPRWDRFRTFNLLCYTMYCFEYGETERGRVALDLLVRDSPKTLRRVLVEPSDRFSAETVSTVRRETIARLEREGSRTGKPVYAELLRELSAPRPDRPNARE